MLRDYLRRDGRRRRPRRTRQGRTNWLRGDARRGDGRLFLDFVNLYLGLGQLDNRRRSSRYRRSDRLRPPQGSLGGKRWGGYGLRNGLFAPARGFCFNCGLHGYGFLFFLLWYGRDNAEAAPDFVCGLFFQRTGVGLFAGYAQTGQQVKNAVRLDLQLPCQLVDANFTHKTSVSRPRARRCDRYPFSLNLLSYQIHLSPTLLHLVPPG